MSDQCKVMVWPNGPFRDYQCTRRAVTDGYCKQHHPDAVAARLVKSDAAYEAKEAASPLGRLKMARAQIERLEQRIEALEYDNAHLVSRLTVYGEVE